MKFFSLSYLPEPGRRRTGAAVLFALVLSVGSLALAACGYHPPATDASVPVHGDNGGGGGGGGM